MALNVLWVLFSVEGIQRRILRDNEDDIIVRLAIRPTSRKLAARRTAQIKRLRKDLPVHFLGKKRNEIATCVNERRGENGLIRVHACVLGVDLPGSDISLGKRRRNAE